MAYNYKDDTYTCDSCGFTEKWDESDDIHGALFTCEICGAVFCTKCFIDRCGSVEYESMMHGDDPVCCPECRERVPKT